MSGGIPSGAVGASIGVLLYSTICTTLTTSLTGLLISFGEAWSYVTIFSGFTALSSFASVVQQLHYVTSWRIIKEAQFQKAVESLTNKGLAFGGAAQILDQVLFFIQFYCYNVMSLNILFWSVALFTGSWGFRCMWLGNWHDRLAPISKVFAVTFPAVVVGLMQVEAIQTSAAGFIIVSYITLFTSLSVGSMLLILMLYKYMKTRRLASGSHRRGRWWASDGKSQSGSESATGTGTVDTANASTVRRSIYDRALVTRFTIGFVILAVFEVAIIVFTLFQANNNAMIAAAGEPDFTVQGSVFDILFFIPGVTASLAAFLVFGTTKSWRQYRDLVLGGCGLKQRLLYKKRLRDEETSRSQGLEFERLPSLQKRASEEQRKVVKESEARVRMFAREIGRDSESAAGNSRAPTRDRAPSDGHTPHYAEPISSTTIRIHHTAPSPTHDSVVIDPEDQVVQYERRHEKKQSQTSVTERRLSDST